MSRSAGFVAKMVQKKLSAAHKTLDRLQGAGTTRTRFALGARFRFAVSVGTCLQENTKIPTAMCNDNFIRYAHKFIVEAKVTWLEATIAAPVFSGLVTHDLEGLADERGNLMQVILGKAELAWGVRGNLFSFLLPWERVLAELYAKFEDGDLSEWPLSLDVLCHIFSCAWCAVLRI